MDDLLRMWRRRQTGEPLSCDRCNGAVVLSVGAHSYRWGCRSCGRKSERFAVDPDGAVRAVFGRASAFAREAVIGRLLAALGA
jgi:hypothetical protein